MIGKRISARAHVDQYGQDERMQMAAALLPELVGMAIGIHGRTPRAKAAALRAWCELAGLWSWTPAMVLDVEREMAR